MTLSDMASYVCEKVRQEDSRALTRCKGFLRQRYELIYNEALWRDALYLFPFTFVPNDPSTTIYRPESWDSTWMMPSAVDKVVGLRTGNQEITASGQEVLLKGNLDNWAQEGDPVMFATLATCVVILPADYTFHDAAIIGGDAGTSWTAHVIDGNGDRTKVSGLGGITTVLSSDTRVVERISRVSAGGPLSLTVDNTDRTIREIGVGVYAFPPRLPIRLFPAPTGSVALSALVKKKVIPLDDDRDTPELRNVDNCLLAFAQADMLEYARQYGKASAKFGEAGGILTQLKANHTWQEQTRMRLEPEVDVISGQASDDLYGKSWW